MKANEKKKKQPAFDADTFLATMDSGRSIATYRKNQTVFSQAIRLMPSFTFRRARSRSA